MAWTGQQVDHEALAPRMMVADAAHTRARLAHVARQSPLLETRPTLASLRTTDSARPEAVFAGIGLVSGTSVSQALPVDVLGLVLGAEAVRRAAGAKHLVILVADAHALAQGADPEQVHAAAALYAGLLRQVRSRCDLPEMRILRALELDEDPAFRRTLQDVAARAPADADAYVSREVADIAYLREHYPGLVKVGWALKPSDAGAVRDERMFDRCFRSWLRADTWFMYTKAGRAFDDRRQKAPPYVVRAVDRRICLTAGEDVEAKLKANRRRVSDDTFRGVCNHLRAITRSYSRLVRPLSGPLPVRTQHMLDDILGSSSERARE